MEVRIEVHLEYKNIMRVWSTLYTLSSNAADIQKHMCVKDLIDASKVHTTKVVKFVALYT